MLGAILKLGLHDDSNIVRSDRNPALKVELHERRGDAIQPHVMSRRSFGVSGIDLITPIIACPS